MTVDQLISRLKEFDGDLPVVTKGFDEGGIDDIENVKKITIEVNVNLDNWHYGKHEESDTGDSAVFIDY